MSNHPVPATNTPMQKAFNWDETFAETKALVQEDAELTATIDEAMVKRFQGRVQIGLNLTALQKNHSKKGYGDFTTTVLPELGIDKRFAQRCISVARLFQSQDLNATSLSHSNLFDTPLPMDTWYKLASSTGQTIIKQIEAGEIEATPEAIKEANEKLKQAEQAKYELQKAFDLFKQQTEQEQKRGSERKQQELDLKNRELDILRRQTQLQEKEYEKLELEKKQVEQSKVQILQEDTPETKARLEEVEQKLQRLEAQEKKLKDKNKEKSDQLKQKVERIQELTKEIQSYNRENQLIAHNREIRFKWQQACDAFHLGINQGFARMVTPLDAQQAFESDDWARLAELENTFKDSLKKISDLRQNAMSQFVDASMDYVVEA